MDRIAYTDEEAEAQFQDNDVRARGQDMLRAAMNYDNRTSNVTSTAQQSQAVSTELRIRKIK